MQLRSAPNAVSVMMDTDRVSTRHLLPKQAFREMILTSPATQQRSVSSFSLQHKGGTLLRLRFPLRIGRRPLQ